MGSRENNNQARPTGRCQQVNQHAAAVTADYEGNAGEKSSSTLRCVTLAASNGRSKPTTIVTAKMTGSGVGAIGGQRQVQRKTADAAPSNKHQQQRAKIIKKPYVRFDDYLDLSEENMRRSCKRLMNQLYCEPGAELAPPALTGPSNLRGGPASPPLPPTSEHSEAVAQSKQAADGQSQEHQNLPALSARATKANLLGNHYLKPTTASSEKPLPPSPPPSATQQQLRPNGKSYLRLEYERRQRRQSELTIKMQKQRHDQLQPALPESNQASECDEQQTRNDGCKLRVGTVNSQRQQQDHQDSVAKSHELSKRRFFEKLERRESMKNSNPDTRSGLHQHYLNKLRPSGCRPVPKSTAAGVAAANTPKLDAADEEECRPEEHQHSVKHKVKNFPSVNEDMPRPEAHQANLVTPHKSADATSGDTLRESSLPPTSQLAEAPKEETYGANPKGLPDNLIGYHTPSPPQLPSLATAKQASMGVAGEHEPLIEFSQGRNSPQEGLVWQANSPDNCLGNSGGSERRTHKESVATFEESAFEIKVPARDLLSVDLGSDTSASELFARCSSHLVVKQVDETSQGRNACVNFYRLSPSTTMTEEHHHQSSQVCSQLESNKMLQTAAVATRTGKAAHCKTSAASFGGAVTLNSQERIKCDKQFSASAHNSNQQHHGGGVISPAISSPQKTSNKAAAQLETIFSPGDRVHATTSKPADKSETAAVNTHEKVAAREAQRCVFVRSSDEKKQGYQLSGELNRINTGATPETAMALVGQLKANSGGNHERIHKFNEEADTEGGALQASRPVQIESAAAQAQQVAATAIDCWPLARAEHFGAEQEETARSNPETMITNKFAIRDVPPEANGEFNRSAADVNLHDGAIVLAPSSSGSESNGPPPMPLIKAGGNEHESGRAQVNEAEQLTHEQPAASATGLSERLSSSFELPLVLRRRQQQLPQKRQQLKDEPTSGQREQRDRELFKIEKEYANPNCGAGRITATKMVSNVNHDYDGQVSVFVEKNPSVENCEKELAVNSLGGYPSVSTAMTIGESCSTRYNAKATLANEEDIGSSCSSSGFGASVAATSSSSASSSDGHSLNEKNLIIADIQRTENYAQLLVSGESNPVQHSKHAMDEFPGYKQLIGPDQAYPGRKARPLLVENHSYATLTNCFPAQTPALEIAGADCLPMSRRSCCEHERLSCQYANLPNGKTRAQLGRATAAAVEYATVRATQPTASIMAQVLHVTKDKSCASASDENDRHNSASSEASSRGLSYSTSSATSGGFSKLPPAHIIDCPSANDFDSINADHNGCISSELKQAKKTSLLRRFGSLVSKAFTSAGTVADAADSPSALCVNELDFRMAPRPAAHSVCSIGPIDRALQDQTDDEIAAGEWNAGNNAGAPPPTTLKKSANIVEQRDPQVVVCGPTALRGSGTIGKVDEVDLVVLPSKRQINQQRPHRKLPAPLRSAGNSQRRRSVDEIARHTANRLPRVAARRHSRRVLRRTKSPTRTPTDTSSSMQYLSLTGSSSYSSEMCSGGNRSRKQQLRRRANSLSEELESLMSRSDCKEHNNDKDLAKESKNNSRSKGKRDKRHQKLARVECIDIDCVAPAELQQTEAAHQLAASKSKSLLRWFSTAGSATESPKRNRSSSNNHPLPSSSTNDCKGDELMSSFWGFSSLIEQNHVNQSKNGLNSKLVGRGDKRPSGSKLKTNKNSPAVAATTIYEKEPASLIYSNVHRANLEAKYQLCRADEVDLADKNCEMNDVNERCQSLNLYQNLLRGYMKRRHTTRHNHQSGHNNRSSDGFYRHHYHHHHHHSSPRHTHRTTSTRCANTNCSASQPCLSSSSSSECLFRSCSSRDGSGSDEQCASRKEQRQPFRASVWGQLIKISKSGGSQVIELQRSPGKSWGFFVARGAIHNVKGIFISRMHDDAASSSLTGLLSIGDRILAIDDCPIEADYDILKVNQMISKKTKILLRVRPFKG